MNEKKARKKEKLRIPRGLLVSVCLMCYDMLTVMLAFTIALYMASGRVDNITNHMNEYYMFLQVYIVVTIFIFWKARLYNSIWKLVTAYDVIRLILANLITLTIHIIGVIVLFGKTPIFFFILGLFLQTVGTLGVRFAHRLIDYVIEKKKKAGVRKKKVMLVGSGEAAREVLRDVHGLTEVGARIVCIISRDEREKNRYIAGVPIVGNIEDIKKNVEKYDVEMIYIVLPQINPEEKKDIIVLCNETGCEVKVLLDFAERNKKDAKVENLRKVDVQDLLGRAPIKVNDTEIDHFISGKVVLVTGGGGSIGSELCRKIAEKNPKQLIIFDVYENNAYDIQQELMKKYPKLNLETIIGSVRDIRKLYRIFDEYKPNLVYHAAAHKHVPLMEDSPCEAIKNNTIGTYKTALAAMMCGVERFILISTDKAVNPTNIMGASKRMCEMIVQIFDSKVKKGKAYEIPLLFTHKLTEKENNDDVIEKLKEAKTEFVAVRFGNVLGSNGSVIPLFKKQIEEGGPVTITHPDIIRFFMTIPEAVSLVLQAGCYAKGGEIFVLDMGSPMKIDTLARNLITLLGYEPDVDIKIVYTGLRKGEKLYEEVLMSEEGLEKTSNELIFIGKPMAFDEDYVLEEFKNLMYESYDNSKHIRKTVAKIVNTYHPIMEE